MNNLFEANGDEFLLVQNKKKKGLSIGAFVRIPMGEKWFLEPQFNFVENKAQFMAGMDQSVPSTMDFTVRTMEAPILISRKIAFLKLKGGPVFSKFFDSKGHTNDPSIFTGIPEGNKEFGVGYHLGFGLDLGILTMDFAWQRDLNQLELFQSVGGIESPLGQELKSFQFHLGLKLFKSKGAKSGKAPKDIIHAPTES